MPSRIVFGKYEKALITELLNWRSPTSPWKYEIARSPWKFHQPQVAAEDPWSPAHPGHRSRTFQSNPSLRNSMRLFYQQATSQFGVFSLDHQIFHSKSSSSKSPTTQPFGTPCGAIGKFKDLKVNSPRSFTYLPWQFLLRKKIYLYR